MSDTKTDYSDAISSIEEIIDDLTHYRYSDMEIAAHYERLFVPQVSPWRFDLVHQTLLWRLPRDREFD